MVNCIPSAGVGKLQETPIRPAILSKKRRFHVSEDRSRRKRVPQRDANFGPKTNLKVFAYDFFPVAIVVLATAIVFLAVAIAIVGASFGAAMDHFRLQAQVSDRKKICHEDHARGRDD